MALNDMQIRIGGDASGAVNAAQTASKALDQVSKSAATAGKSETQLAKNTDAATAAMNRSAKVAKSASVAMKDLAANNNRVGKGMGNMRFAVQNAAFQMQDMAVMLEMGIDPMRVMGQQVPQLVGSFGALGAVLGLVAGIGFTMAGALSGVNDATANITAAFGAWEPVILAVGAALSTVGSAIVDFANILVNNMETVLSVGAAVAVFFGVRYVTAMAAATVANQKFSASVRAVAISMARLLKRLVIIGVIAGIIDALMRLRKETGSTAGVFKLLGDVVKGVFRNINLYIFASTDYLESWVYAIKAYTLDLVAVTDAQKAHVKNMQELSRLAEESAGNYFMLANELSGVNSLLDAMADRTTTDIDIGDVFSGLLGGGSGADGAENDAISARVQAIREGLMTEEELKQLHYENDLAALTEWRQAGLDVNGEYDQLESELTRAHLQKMENMRIASAQREVSIVGQAGADIVRAVGQNSKKANKIAQVIGASTAFINTMIGASEALKLPWPANLAAAAQVISTGMGFVAAIKSGGTGGGSSGGSAGGSSGGGSSASGGGGSPIEARITGINPDDLYSGASISGLFDKLQDEAGDRGLKVNFA